MGEDGSDRAAGDVTSAGPLAGLRVLDMTIWMAGPVTGMLLADLGADVVKIESPSGDPTRHHVAPTAGAGEAAGETSISYSTFNRNKRSIALDLGTPADRAIFESLLDRADVFVTNLSSSTLAKLRVTADELVARNPRLVYARGAGLGPTGPRADDPAQDMTGMAYGGMLFTLSPDPDQPYAPPGAINDVISGTYLLGGVLAALMQRERTGRGGIVTGSLLQTALWTQFGLVGSLANTEGASIQGRPRTDPRNALLNQYRAADGRWIAVAAINARAWADFVAGAGIEHLTADPRFATYADMLANTAAMRAELDRHFATAPADHWLDQLRAHGVWCGPANRLDEVLTDEHVAANGYLTVQDDGLRTVSMPFTLTGHTPAVAAGPDLGADRESILRDWAVSD
jgi:crotonobetainyl-CoA:carnitine CoA-transferase CaiB-like acyl-CoA transferase